MMLMNMIAMMISMILMIILDQITMIILDQGQSCYFLVSVRKALEEPRAAKPPECFDHKKNGHNFYHMIIMQNLRNFYYMSIMQNYQNFYMI